MQCARCAGMKVPEIIVEGGARIFVMRCVHCGDVVDHVIIMNRIMNRQHPSACVARRARTFIHESHRRT